jgi:hypothetical protein
MIARSYWKERRGLFGALRIARNSSRASEGKPAERVGLGDVDTGARTREKALTGRGATRIGLRSLESVMMVVVRVQNQGEKAIARVEISRTGQPPM